MTYKSLVIITMLFFSVSLTASTTNEVPLYDKKWDSSDGLCRVLKWHEYNGHILPLYGFVDNNDSVVIPIKYDYAEDMCNGYALVAMRHEASTPLPPYAIVWRTPCYKYDYVSKDNKVIRCGFDYATSISSLDASVVIGFTQIRTHFELPSTYWIKKYKVRWEEIKANGFLVAYDYINEDPINEAEVLRNNPVPFDNMLCDKVQCGETFSMSFEGFTIKKGKVFFNESDGGEVIINSIPNDSNYKISEIIKETHCVIVHRHGYAGVYHYDGDKPDFDIEYLPCRYDAINHCGNGIFIACLNGMWGVISMQSEIIQPFTYNLIQKSKFHKGIYEVAKYTGRYRNDFYAGKVPLFDFGCLDSTGRIIVPVKHEGDMGWHSGIRTDHPSLIFAKDTLWSVYDLKGTLLYDNKFSDIRHCAEGWIGLDKDGHEHFF